MKKLILLRLRIFLFSSFFKDDSILSIDKEEALEILIEVLFPKWRWGWKRLWEGIRDIERLIERVNYKCENGIVRGKEFIGKSFI